jgi:hypothetical protein
VSYSTAGVVREHWRSPVLSLLGRRPYDRLERDDDEFFSRVRSLTAKHTERRKESLRVDLITDHRRSLRPDGLKPC